MSVKPQNPSSLAWQYFVDCFDDEFALCVLFAQDCIEKKVKVREHTTAGLRFDLEHDHDTIWADIRNKEKEREGVLSREEKRKADCGMIQPTIFQEEEK